MRQQHLSLVLLMSLLTAFPPLSTDMYLPAIPHLQQLWNQPLSIINLSLVCFFISYCLCLLIYGPLSDRFGRRPPLLCGIAVFTAASILCIFAVDPFSLTVFRILQAAGAAAASALAMAMCKDTYSGREQQRILSYISMIMASAPMIAPVVGSWIMATLSWRWIFVALTLLGAISFIWVYFTPETLKNLPNKDIIHPLSVYKRLLGNRKYTGLLFSLSLAVLPSFAFIAASADIYINTFGFSEQKFGLYFALNAMALMIGSFLCSRLTDRVDRRVLLAAGYLGIVIGSLGLISHFTLGPLRLAIPMFFISLSFGMTTPCANSMILSQVKEYVGAASSLMVLIFFLYGAIAMWLISLNWEDTIEIIGIMGIIAGSCLLLFLMLLSLNPSARETLVRQE